MKTSAILAVAAGAALAAAQLDQFPPCALTCAIGSIGTSGCDTTDIPCVCRATSFLSGVQACISAPGACTPAEIERTLNAAVGFCRQAGVTITPPGTPKPTTSVPEPEPTTAAPEPTTAAPEPEPTTTVPEPEPTTTVPEPEPTTTVPEPEPTATETTSDVVTMTTTTTICPSSTLVPTYAPPPAQNTTVPVPPPSYTGAAGNIVANAGTVLIGAALAMLFA